MARNLALCFAGLVLVSCQSVTPRTWELPPGTSALNVNGYDMAYVERGSGVPVVLLHGSLADYRYWAAQMEPLSARYRAIAPSLRHYYPERWGGGGDTFSLSQHADDLAAFISQLNAGPVHVIAHSRGADVALIAAARRPGTFRSLVLIEPAPFDSMLPDTPVTKKASAQRQEQIASALLQFDKGSIDAGVQAFIDTGFGTGTYAKAADALKQQWRDNALPLKHLQEDAQARFSCGDAGKIDVPVLLVRGERSAPIYGVMLDALQPCLPRHERITIPGAPHGMARTHAQAFNAAALAFLARH